MPPVPVNTTAKSEYYAFEKCMICHTKSAKELWYGDTPRVCGQTPFCRKMASMLCTKCGDHFCRVSVTPLTSISDSNVVFTRDTLSEYCQHCTEKNGKLYLKDRADAGKKRWSLSGTTSDWEATHLCKVCSVRPRRVNIEQCDLANQKPDAVKLNIEGYFAGDSGRKCSNWKTLTTLGDKYHRTCGESYCESVAALVCPQCESNPRKIMSAMRARALYGEEQGKIHTRVMLKLDIGEINKAVFYYKDETLTETLRRHEYVFMKTKFSVAEEYTNIKVVPPSKEYPIGVYKIDDDDGIESLTLTYQPDEVFIFPSPGEGNYSSIKGHEISKFTPLPSSSHSILLNYCSWDCCRERRPKSDSPLINIKLYNSQGSIPENHDPKKLQKVFMYYMDMMQQLFLDTPRTFSIDAFNITKYAHTDTQIVRRHNTGGEGSVYFTRIVVLLAFYFKCLTELERQASYFFPEIIDMQDYVSISATSNDDQKQTLIKKRTTFQSALNSFIRQIESTPDKVRRGVAIATVPNHAVLFVYEKAYHVTPPTLEMHNSNGYDVGYGEAKKQDGRTPVDYFTKNMQLLRDICEIPTLRFWCTPDNLQSGGSSCGLWQVVWAMHRLKGISKENMPRTEIAMNACAKPIFSAVSECLESRFKIEDVIDTDGYTAVYDLTVLLSKAKITPALAHIVDRWEYKYTKNADPIYPYGVPANEKKLLDHIFAKYSRIPTTDPMRATNNLCTLIQNGSPIVVISVPTTSADGVMSMTYELIANVSLDTLAVDYDTKWRAPTLEQLHINTLDRLIFKSEVVRSTTTEKTPTSTSLRTILQKFTITDKHIWTLRNVTQHLGPAGPSTTSEPIVLISGTLEDFHYVMIDQTKFDELYNDLSMWSSKYDDLKKAEWTNPPDDLNTDTAITVSYVNTT
jgi:hypothetical protein